jgi:hypothetical protein
LASKAFLAALVVGMIIHLPLVLLHGELFPDSSAYLDVGRSLFQGDGFVVKINLAALWPGADAQPALSYYNPLFSVLCGLVWHLSGSMPITIVACVVFPLIANAFLLFLIARKLFSVRTAWLSMLIYLALPFCMQNTIILSTEQLGVLGSLTCIWILIRDSSRFHHFAISGVILAGTFFFQVSSLANSMVIMACFALVSWIRDRKIKGALIVATTFFLIISIYQIICVKTTGHLYPYYPEGAKAWSQSQYYLSEYNDGFPVLSLPEFDTAHIFLSSWNFIPIKLFRFAELIWRNIIWLSLFIPLAICQYLPTSRNIKTWLLLAPGVSNILLMTFIYWWLMKIEATRYSIFPIAMLLAPSVHSAECFIDHIERKTNWRAIGKSLKILLIILLTFHFLISYLGFALPGIRTNHALKNESKKALHYMRNRSKDGDLIGIEPATSMMSLSFYADRPVAPLPYMKSSSQSHFNSFAKIYRPKFMAHIVDDIAINLLGLDNKYDEYIPVLGCWPAIGWKSEFIEIWQCP